MKAPPAIPFEQLLSLPLWNLAERPLRTVRVAVLDTGVDASHEALRGRVVRSGAWRRDPHGTIVRSPLPRTANNDPSGHGTGVAAIIAAMAPNALIEDVRVLDADNGGFGSVVLRGLRDAVEGPAAVINVSVAFAKNRYWEDAARLLEEAVLRGKVVVASKRNVPRPDDLGMPAELANAVGVDSAAFSSPFLFKFFRGTPVEFAATGSAVLTARSGGGWIRLSGTSFATPVVSGLCALFLGADPSLSLFEVKTLLKHHALRTQETRRAKTPPPNPLETAPTAAEGSSFQIDWTCPACGARRRVPDAFPSVRCPACGAASRRAVLLDPQICAELLGGLRRSIPPAFRYHDAEHARAVADAVFRILPHHPSLSVAQCRDLLLAALLHDFGWAEDPEAHEEASARAAEDVCRSFRISERRTERIRRLVLATRPGHVPRDLCERIIQDADLFHVGTPSQRLRERLLRQELAARGRVFTNAEWRRRQIEFLQAHRFHLAWLERERRPAREAELARLRRRETQDRP